VRTEPLRRPARSGAVGDELAQRVAVAGDQRVNGVGRAADDPAGVPPPVRPDQVPAGVALLLGIASRNRRASSSSNGKKASFPPRSNEATTRAAHRQKRQPPS